MANLGGVLAWRWRFDEVHQSRAFWTVDVSAVALRDPVVLQGTIVVGWREADALSLWEIVSERPAPVCPARRRGESLQCSPVGRPARRVGPGEV